MTSDSSTMCMIYIICIFAVIVLCMLGIVVYSTCQHRKKMAELMMYQINVTANIDKSIPEILNLIIQESFDDYQVKFLAPMNEGYLKPEREIEIRKDLVDIVTKRISSATMDKLSLIYNPRNIADILADKIYITVMKYVADHNSAFVEQDK